MPLLGEAGGWPAGLERLPKRAPGSPAVQGGALPGLPAVGVLGEVGRGQGLGPGVTR